MSMSLSGLLTRKESTDPPLGDPNRGFPVCNLLISCFSPGLFSLLPVSSCPCTGLRGDEVNSKEKGSIL